MTGVQTCALPIFERVKGLLVELSPSYWEGKFAPHTKEEAISKMKEIYDIFAARGVRSKDLDDWFSKNAPSQRTWVRE